MEDTTSTFDSLRDNLLIAMPGLEDGLFTGSVTYMCEHDPEGALGIVINRPTDITFADLFGEEEVDILEDYRDITVLAGGPVNMNRGFILHDGEHEWESSLTLPNGLKLTTSRDIIYAIARGEGPSNFIITLGYAGWGPGQLEEEITDNAWLNAPASEDIIFDTPFDHRAEKALAQMGVDYHLISHQAGHA
jgi:putative transcriptional regulator